jgi:hypothetical protein
LFVNSFESALEFKKHVASKNSSIEIECYLHSFASNVSAIQHTFSQVLSNLVVKGCPAAKLKSVLNYYNICQLFSFEFKVTFDEPSSLIFQQKNLQVFFSSFF